jgi:hypothetical protein
MRLFCAFLVLLITNLLVAQEKKTAKALYISNPLTGFVPISGLPPTGGKR